MLRYEQQRIDDIYGKGEWKLIRYTESHAAVIIKHKCGRYRSISRAVTFNKGNTKCACYYKEGSKMREKREKEITRLGLDRFEHINKIIEKETNKEYCLDWIGKNYLYIRHKECGSVIKTTELEFKEDKKRCTSCYYKKKEIPSKVDSEVKRKKYNKRNSTLIKQVKKYFKDKNGRHYCEICEFDFEEAYGSIGKDYIIAHHKIPLKCGGLDIEENIILVCGNCHEMLHSSAINTNKTKLNPEKLKDIVISNKLRLNTKRK